MFLHFAFHHLVVVGVNHDGIRIISHSEESLQRVVPILWRVAGTDHHVVGICISAMLTRVLLLSRRSMTNVHPSGT